MTLIMIRTILLLALSIDILSLECLSALILMGHYLNVDISCLWSGYGDNGGDWLLSCWYWRSWAKMWIRVWRYKWGSVAHMGIMISLWPKRQLPSALTVELILPKLSSSGPSCLQVCNFASLQVCKWPPNLKNSKQSAIVTVPYGTWEDRNWVTWCDSYNLCSCIQYNIYCFRRTPCKYDKSFCWLFLASLE